MTETPQVDFEEVVKASGMPVTEEEIRDRFNAIATEEGIITNTSRMSPFWRLVTAIVTAPVMWLKEVLISTVLANMFVATASGSMLRLLAWAVNITPKPASAAQGVTRTSSPEHPISPRIMRAFLYPFPDLTRRILSASFI